MKRSLTLSLAAALVGGLALAGPATASTTGGSGASPVAKPRATSVIAADGQALKLDETRIEFAEAIVKEAAVHYASRRAKRIALAVALAESHLSNYGSATYPTTKPWAYPAGTMGGSDAVGIFQLRPQGGWGIPEDLMNPRLAARAFYVGTAYGTSSQGLLNVKNWTTMSLADAAQATMRSAYPQAYANWQPAADSLLSYLENGPDLVSKTFSMTAPLTTTPGKTVTVKVTGLIKGEIYTFSSATNGPKWGYAVSPTEPVVYKANFDKKGKYTLKLVGAHSGRVVTKTITVK